MRHLKTRFMLTLSLLLCLAVGGRPTGAVDDPWTEMEDSSLLRFRGLEVVVGKISPDAERDGLTRAVLQTRIESGLRKAGMCVLEKGESSMLPGAASLRVKVDTMGDNTRLCVITISVSLTETLAYDRDQFPGRLPHIVNRLINEFSSAFLVASPIDRSTTEQKKQND